MSFSLKVIACLHLGPWKFQKLQSSPFSSTSGQLLCSPPPALYAARPPLWAASPRHLFLALAPTRRSQPAPSLLGRALELPSLATQPRTAQRPPPRRRSGGLAAEPQASNSRAQQHQGDSFMLSRTLSLQFPDPNPQNSAAVRSNPGKLHTAVEPTSPQPLRPC